MRISDWSSDVCSSDLRSSRARTVPMSVTIPVNMASLIPSHPLVDVEPVAAKQAAVSEAPAPVGLRQIGQADVAERRAAAADQDRRAIEQQPVDAVGGQVQIAIRLPIEAARFPAQAVSDPGPPDQIGSTSGRDRAGQYR